jgi:uroporphyrinogen-III synthase
MIHVLVTRPLEASLQLAGQLESQGFHPVVMPFYTFSAYQPALDLSTAWSTPAVRRLAVFTSPRAVQFGLSHIPADQLDRLEFAAVGSATRATLEESGCTVHLQATTGYTSEDLLKVPELAVDPGIAIIFCAPEGRATLAEGLLAKGWSVVNAMVYQRVPLQPGDEQLEILRNLGMSSSKYCVMLSA